jgi:hypothetical protein
MKPITENTPLEDVKKALAEAGRRIPGDLFHRANSLRQIYASRTTCAAYFNDHVRKDTALLIKELMQEIWDAKDNLRKKTSSSGGIGKAAKLIEPKKNIRKAWATGNFSSRDICAEEEYSSLGFESFRTARTELKGTPDPDPWPAKKKAKKKI